MKHLVQVYYRKKKKNVCLKLIDEIKSKTLYTFNVYLDNWIIYFIKSLT